jgi:hypothetical protein
VYFRIRGRRTDEALDVLRLLWSVPPQADPADQRDQLSAFAERFGLG